jgi:hypothetical protein
VQFVKGLLFLFITTWAENQLKHHFFRCWDRDWVVLFLHKYWSCIAVLIIKIFYFKV